MELRSRRNPVHPELAEGMKRRRRRRRKEEGGGGGRRRRRSKSRDLTWQVGKNVQKSKNRKYAA